MPLKQPNTPRRAFAPGQHVRLLASIALLVVMVVIAGLVFLIHRTRELAHEASVLQVTNIEKPPAAINIPAPFPLGVDPLHKKITEAPEVDLYFKSEITSNRVAYHSKDTWFGKVIAKLTQEAWYQNLASPSARILVIESGERKEEVAKHFGDILNWSEKDRMLFITTIAKEDPEIADGKFFPATYVVARDASAADVATLVSERFAKEVSSRYQGGIERILPITEALTIASLLEREAYDFDDMREISGVIWNRLFAGMRLQIDATLQYTKASKRGGDWWPKVLPEDKQIGSPYNTYINAGLPPAPIANPSLDAILAALNPRKTDCMFYFHDSHGNFHCTKTYQEHVAALKEIYGRGK